MKSRTMIIAAGLPLGLAGVAAAMWLPVSGGEGRPSASASLMQANFSVENMTCATCPITVRKAMQAVDGVHDVSVDYAAKTATARFDPARTSVGAIAAASANAGYPARARGSL